MKYFIDIGDSRNVILLRLMKDDGASAVELKHNTEAEKGDACIFSPAKKFNLEEAKAFKKNITVFAGNVSAEVKAEFDIKNIKHINFMEDEIFAYKNAWLTAEGTLAEILVNTQKSLYQNKYLLLGYGRCSRALGLLFNKMGIKYDIVSFTKEHLEQSCIFAEQSYFKYEFLPHLKNYDVTVNSIPAKIFEDDMLSKFKPGGCVLEIASVNCLDSAKVKGFKYVLCPALPKKYTCESAAKLMYEKIKEQRIK